MCSMEKWKHWLKRSYTETPTEGPEAKRVKFSDIHEALVQQFLSDEISSQMCTNIVQEVFPRMKRTRIGKQRLSYMVGIEESHTDCTDTLQAENVQLRATVHQLQERIRQLETETSASASTCVCISLLMQQMDSLTRHGDQILHGPNTPARFPEFSMNDITEEIRKNAPDVYQLFLRLGDTDRNLTDSKETPVEQRKAIMSLCTILNARCRTANGLQLLLSFMLIARATSKQVKNMPIMLYTPLHYIMCTVHLIFSAGNHCP